MSKIEWTGATWNPIVGCSIVSPGCTNCYAMRMAARLEAMATADRPRWTKAHRNGQMLSHYVGTTQPSKAGPVWTGKVAIAPDHILTKPLRTRKPTTWFVNSMSDLFHEDVPDEWIDRVFAVMAMCQQHTFQVLTKRSARMRDYCTSTTTFGRFTSLLTSIVQDDGRITVDYVADGIRGFHLANVWLGVSAERQQEADARVPDLLATPAAVRFVSAEPLLGPIDFSFVGNADGRDGAHRYNALTGHALPWAGVMGGVGVWSTNLATPCAKLDWIIVGGESGPGARPMHPDWVRAIRDQCHGSDDRLQSTGAPSVAFFFKQWGEWAPYSLHPVSHESGALTEMTCVSSTDRREVGGISYLAGCGEGKPSIPLRKIGKSRAGRLLDGREWNEMPERMP